ncbi:MAG: hypothetical protein KDK51_11190, partial [Deltaproteobacteria bacterium]|nr:hypothetical protein [Deltaproteobacteria bacterium]
PINQKTKEQLEQEQREKEQKEEQVSTPKTFVAKAPPSVNEFCNAIQQEVGSKDVKTLIWGITMNQDKDGLKDDCEAILMAARYTGDLVNDTEIYDKILDYYAVHPKRTNGFLVGAVYFPDKHFEQKAKAHKAEDKDFKDVLKANRRRNSELGENEKITKYKGVSIPNYSYHVWNEFFSLKNEGEGDLPSWRRLFNGMSTDGSNDIDIKADIGDRKKPTLVKGIRKRKVERFDEKYDVERSKVIESKQISSLLKVDATPVTEHLAHVRGGNAEGIPFPMGTAGISLGKLSGIFQDSETLRQNGQFMYVAETYLVVDEEIDLAIGHLERKQGDKYVYGGSSGTIIALVDGETKLIATNTVNNSKDSLTNELKVSISSKSGEDCRSTHLVLIFLPESEKFGDTFKDAILGESVFYRKSAKTGDAPWYPLHEGITSISPVSIDNAGASCAMAENKKFFNDLTPASPESFYEKEYKGDSYVYIADPKIEDNAVTFYVEIYGKKYSDLAPKDFSFVMEISGATSNPTPTVSFP